MVFWLLKLTELTSFKSFLEHETTLLMSNPRFLGPLIGIETPSRWPDQCLQGDCGLLGRCHIVQSRWNRLRNQKTRKLQRLCRYLAKDLLWKSQYDTIASGQQACCKLIVQVFYPQVCDKFQQVVTKDRKWQVATNVILSFLYVYMVNTIYLLSFVETPRKFIIAELSIRKLGSSSVLIIIIILLRS